MFRKLRDDGRVEGEYISDEERCVKSDDSIAEEI